MQRRAFTIPLVAISSVALIGCAAVEQDPQSAGTTAGNRIKAYTEKMIAAAGSNEYTASERNNLIDNYVILYNLQYVDYVKQLGVGKKSIDTGYDIGTLGLNLAGALTGGIRAKENLAAGAGLITGAKLSVDKHFYYEQTLPLLIAGMDNRRKEILIRMMVGRQSPIASYPFAQAQSDLTEYQIAGTLDGGIKNLQVQAASQQEKLDAKLEFLSPATVEQIGQRKQIGLRLSVLKNDPGSLNEVNRILVALDSAVLPYKEQGPAMADLEARFRSMNASDVAKWMAALNIQ